MLIRSLVEVLVVTQAVQATVTGTVRDEATGRPLSGIVVMMPDLDRATVTGADGSYVIRDIAPGPQHLRVESIGYTDRTLHALVPREGSLRIDITLQAEPVVLPSVDVRRRTDVHDAAANGPAEHRVAMAGLRDHPLLAEPDPFLALTSGTVRASPETPAGLHVRGGAADQTAWLLDGIPVLNPYHAAGVFSAWNPDALSAIELRSSLPSGRAPAALSGVVAATVRASGERLGARGSVSTTQASMTLDGPVGAGGWMLSARSTFPDVVSPRESSYLGGRTADWLARVEVPAACGAVSVLAYDNSNSFDASARVPTGEDAGEGAGRNGFGWHSRSIGAAWTAGSARVVSIRAWSATTDADSHWLTGSDAFVDLGSKRTDTGGSASIELRGSAVTTVGIRFERSRTEYGIEPAAAFGADVATPVFSVFVERSGRIGSRAGLDAGVTIAAGAGGVHPSPGLRLSLQPHSAISLSAAWARTRQFVQSVRNAESIVGAVFPADLFVGASDPDIPVASSDVGLATIAYQPSPGLDVRMEAYVRSFAGLALVAPVEGEPFATRAIAEGTGTGRGISVDATIRGARYSALARWGWRRVRLTAGNTSYAPSFANAHDLETGLVFHPGSTSSIRLGVTGLFGRRTTPIAGPFEWESCNLLDLGCEFAGSPHNVAGTPGDSTLPAYVRLDLGVRRHWHVSALGRDATVALSATITNIIGRSNVLTWAADPLTGAATAIEMRPRAPLVVGLDWRF